MKGKTLAYTLPVLAAVLLGAGTVSAHGWMRNDVSPEDIAKKHQAMFEQQAELLGLNVQDLKDAWANGKSFKDIAKEKGMSEEDLHAKMKESMKTRMQEELNALVEKGVISKEQAAKRLEIMNTRMEEHKDFKGGKAFRHMGMGSHKGFSPSN